MNRFTALIFLLICGAGAHAQKPEIVSIDKTNGANGEIVTINGNDFGSNQTSLKVFFGGAFAEIKNSGNQIVEVEIPAGATYDNIAVINTTSGLSTYSKQRFFNNFSGEHGIDAAKFSSQNDFPAESGLYDICSCDFNEDGKVDFATVGEKSNSISYLINNSTPGSVSFAAKSNILVNAETIHVTCGDLNGDGHADIVATENDGDRVFILKNSGSATFTTQTIKLTGNKVKRISIADLDLNGKPDLVITDQLKNIITILSNQSNTSSIAFASPVKVTLPNALSSDGLDVMDMNGDGLPEIMTSPFFTSANNKIFVLINHSSPGTFNFDDKVVIDASNTIVNIKIADIDGDEKPDFAVTRILNSDIQIYRNTGANGSLSFAEPVSLLTSTRPWGIDFGDLDGDGKLDIAVASIDTKAITILDNESTPGNISFADKVSVPTTFINKHLKLGDIDGDAKPDISFTSIDDGNNAIIASKVSVIKNKACLLPKVSPEGPLVICTGLEFDLRATKSAGTLYLWKNNGVDIGTAGTSSSLHVTAAGEYSVVASSSGCNKTSAVISVQQITPSFGLNSNDPEARNNGPICSGNTLTLQVDDVDATTYRWHGPNGYLQESTGLTASRTNFEIVDAGKYIVEMIVDGCVSKTDTTVVEGVNVPEFSLNFSGTPLICEGETKTLSASPLATSGFTFKWFKGSGEIAGATASSYAVSETGSYHLSLQSTNVGCAPVVTESVDVSVVAAPKADFTIPATICLGTITEITNNSTFAQETTPIFTWSMGEGSDITGQNPDHTYTTVGPKTVTLVLTYDGVSGCSDEATASTEVIQPILPEILSTKSSLCAEDSTILSIAGDYASIVWSINEGINAITVKEAGDYAVATVDNAGCEGNDQITIESNPSPVLTVTAPKEVINLGESILLTASIEDPLDDNATYAWSPKASLNDSTKATATAKPSETTVYSVIATTEAGCSTTGTITIKVATQGIGITASPLFSPNGDEDNPTWIISGVQNFPDCTLSVFDSHGSMVFQKKGYQNDWNGEYNGHPIPEGVYYYVFSCDDQKTVTGTVTVIY